MIISEQEKSLLLKIARESLEHYLRTGQILEYDQKLIPDVFLANFGVFVTLTIEKKLRGCIGRFTSELPLYRLVQEIAISSAERDYRFGPLRYDELMKVKIELSILGKLQKINSPDEIIPGKHGIYLKKDTRSGTYLPKVATEMAWNALQFVENCAESKAGLGRDGWKDAEMFVYDTYSFSE